MRRIVLLVVVALVMATTMLASALPVFAAPNCEGRGSPHPSGQHRAHSNADDRGDVEQSDKHYNKEVACDDDVPPGEGQ
jgi:hypothetical protein